MGNYTWFVKCFSNGSTTEPCVDMISCLVNVYPRIYWWFRDWKDTNLNEYQKGILNLFLEKKYDNHQFRTLAEADPTFPRIISLNSLMQICHDHKFYGYFDVEMKAVMEKIGQCIPTDRFCFFIGIYEGFGPVAMGWTAKQDGKPRFQSMMGFEHYKVYSPELLTRDIDLKTWLQKDEDEEDFLRKEYEEAADFRKDVMEKIDSEKWSNPTVDPMKWLSRHGFEKNSYHTADKEYNMMCPQQ